jgi:3-oxoadipate enol-lactonase
MQRVTLDDDVRLAYRVDGDEALPALVLVNSLGTDLRMWEPQVATLSRHFRIVRFDMRGHGQSEVSDGAYPLDRLGRDLLGLLDHLQIVQAHICGISLGGLVAQWVAIHHPERVRRAIFANTAARIGSVESWTARIDAVRSGGMAAIRETVVARFLSPAFRTTHPEVGQALGNTLEAINPIGYIAACGALRDADLRPMVSTIRVPVQILAGELDGSTPPAQAAELHAAISASQLVVFPATAHLSNLEQAEAFNACVIEFLTGR